jgi:hypothetical protein
MRLVLLLLLACLVTGCATITRGTKDVLVVESNPPGANVRLSTGHTSRTPATFKLARKENVMVEIYKEGYESVEVHVQPHIEGAGAAGMAGNVIVGGLIGLAVDAGTGAMYGLIPNPVRVDLQPIDGSAVAPRNDTNSIEARLEDLDALKEKGLITDAEYEERRRQILGDL